MLSEVPMAPADKTDAVGFFQGVLIIELLQGISMSKLPNNYAEILLPAVSTTLSNLIRSNGWLKRSTSFVGPQSTLTVGASVSISRTWARTRTWVRRISCRVKQGPRAYQVTRVRPCRMAYSFQG